MSLYFLSLLDNSYEQRPYYLSYPNKTKLILKSHPYSATTHFLTDIYNSIPRKLCLYSFLQTPSSYSLQNVFQSGFVPHHSPEMVLVKVTKVSTCLNPMVKAQSPYLKHLQHSTQRMTLPPLLLASGIPLSSVSPPTSQAPPQLLCGSPSSNEVFQGPSMEYFSLATLSLDALILSMTSTTNDSIFLSPSSVWNVLSP